MNHSLFSECIKLTLNKDVIISETGDGKAFLLHYVMCYVKINNFKARMVSLRLSKGKNFQTCFQLSLLRELDRISLHLQIPVHFN